ncbi:hypothetical protein OG718_02040 [Streptomyces sp. NBC_00258]
MKRGNLRGVSKSVLRSLATPYAWTKPRPSTCSTSPGPPPTAPGCAVPNPSRRGCRSERLTQRPSSTR